MWEKRREKVVVLGSRNPRRNPQRSRPARVVTGPVPETVSLSPSVFRLQFAPGCSACRQARRGERRQVIPLVKPPVVRILSVGFDALPEVHVLLVGDDPGRAVRLIHL